MWEWSNQCLRKDSNSHPCPSWCFRHKMEQMWYTEVLARPPLLKLIHLVSWKVEFKGCIQDFFCCCAGSRTQGLAYTRQVLHHWATSQAWNVKFLVVRGYIGQICLLCLRKHRQSITDVDPCLPYLFNKHSMVKGNRPGRDHLTQNGLGSLGLGQWTPTHYLQNHLVSGTQQWVKESVYSRRYEGRNHENRNWKCKKRLLSTF